MIKSSGKDFKIEVRHLHGMETIEEINKYLSLIDTLRKKYTVAEVLDALGELGGSPSGYDYDGLASFIIEQGYERDYT